MIHKKQRCGTFGRRCKHYDGMNATDPEKRCKAGVLMSAVTVLHPYQYRYGGRGTVYTSNVSMPCFQGDDPDGVCHCEHQAFPTAEEIAAHDKETEELFSRVVTARLAIIEATGGKRGVAGKIDCPVCKTGTLGYSVASLNGHIWGKCSTEGCVAWME